MIPSNYQKSILDQAINNPRTNILVNALAGTGKTSTIKLLDEHLKGRNLYLVFNKRNAEEAKSKLRCNVSTFNAFGYSLFPRKVKVNSYKTLNIIDTHFPKLKKHGFAIQKLVSLYRSHCGKVSFEDLCDKFDITEKCIEGAGQVLGVWGNWTKEIDFDDQLHLPIMNGYPFPDFDTVYVDECQDLNPLKIRFVSEFIRNGARIIAVGDVNQAIYGFAGADVEAIETLKKVLDPISLPLNLNYRCSRAVIKEAKRLVPEIEAHDAAPEGEVKTVKTVEAREGDYIICRCTAPLVKLCMKLIREGYSACVLGKEIGDGLLKIIKDIGAVDFVLLDKWYEDQKIKYEAKKKDTIDLTDKYDTIRYLFEGNDTLDQVIKRIENIFSDKGDKITLLTAHKSKGLEANRVFVIERSLFPHPRAKNDWQLVQEKNLEYVAITRARESLYYVE